MKYRNKLIVIAAVVACGILVQCGEEKKQGLLQGPVMSINQLPVAKAGADKNVYLYTGSVELDGSKSFDPEGKNLTFSWEIVHRPAGSAASFSDSTKVKTTLTFDTAGTYEIMVTVSDGSRTASDLVTVYVADNTGATANAGPDQEVGFGDIVTLDGSGSADPEGDTLTYTWTQISGPAVGAGTLSGANPTFAAPSEVCTIVYDLTVNDGSGNSLADRVYIFVMKKAGAGIYVSTTGDDIANDGKTRTAPKQTIQAGIAAALAAGCDVYVGNGDYGESLALANGVSIYGGFLHTTWERNTTTFQTSIQGSTVAVDGNGVNNLVIDGLSITSDDATAAGGGSYAVRLISSNVVFNDCIITAGNGAPGLAGTDGANGQTGGAGGNGQNGDEDGEGGAGGSGGTGYNGNSGGRGGNGIYDAYSRGQNGEDGQYGLKNGISITQGGSGGLRGRPGTQGDYGTAGLNGYSGTNGPAGISGSLVSNLWVSSNGTAGTDGEGGCGGGGGGGGGGQYGGLVVNGGGNGGGGGGGGGGLGTGGTGGNGGGASFGFLLINSVITASYCDISSGNGGNGGRGGTGGSGAAGGSGGSGASHATDEIGAGGSGGAGGHGGNGGHGGGGAGGPSFGIYKSGLSMANVTLSRVAMGSGGTGGASSGNPGSDGDCNSSN
ncbi:MAG: hypothetical protein KA369_17785 [Spirochaetes bacterium]|nr:hypothetical protein [Spirochaetota bacterium]